MESLTQFEDLALVMVDLDDFKQVNDHWGHQYGDSVLVSLAGHLMLPPPEGVPRWGGEEFIALARL